MSYRVGHEEKRGFARMGIECPATFCIDGDSTSYHAMATDLSATGLQISSANSLNVGTILMVEVKPEQMIVPPLQAKAEVVRCCENATGGYQLGLKVLEMLPAL